jgi:hypothetical protein
MTVDVSSIDANKALVRRAIGYNHGAADEGASIFWPDFVAHMPGRPPLDRASFEQFVRSPRNRTLGRAARNQHVQSEGRSRRGAVGAVGHAWTAAADRSHPSVGCDPSIPIRSCRVALR